MKSLDKNKTKKLDWNDFVIENNTDFSRDANGIKYEFYEDDLLSFISSLLQKQKEQILNLECLKEEKITKNIFSITQLESRNQLRNEIKKEITKDLFKDFKQVSNPLDEEKYDKP